MKLLSFCIVIALISGASQLNAQNDSVKGKLLDKLELHIYGSILYNNFNWETDSSKRNNVDLYQVIFEPEIAISDRLKLEMEIEFEHGGSGATMEFDRFEEFGEFEQEIEHGGEVIIEELEIAWEVKPWLQIIAGKIKVPVGLANFYDTPVDYHSTSLNNVEETLLPVGWYEIGFGIEGEVGLKKNIIYHLVVINALDNSAFSSANWIKRGSHQRFEYSNAENFAIAARLDHTLNEKSLVGISGYAGNSTPNRPKPDLESDGWATTVDVHTHIVLTDFYLQALGLYGTLQNADIINDANKNLSNNLNVKRTPVGSAVLGYFVEAGYDMLSVFNDDTPAQLFLFAGYYYYDSMFKTAGENFNNPRWERTEIRTGINYQWNETIGVKSDFTYRKINIPEDNIENTFTIALTFNL